MVRFRANNVVVDDSDEEFIAVGFAEELAEEPDGKTRESLTLQRAYEFDESDVAAGLDQVYIERAGQRRCGYGGILRFELHRDRVVIELDSRMAGRLGDHQFEIDFSLDEPGFLDLRAGLQAVFRGFSCFVESPP
jgi:hypothetical protein